MRGTYTSALGDLLRNSSQIFLDNLSYDPRSSPAAISGLCISCFAGDFCLAGVLGSEIAAGEDLGFLSPKLFETVLQTDDNSSLQ